MWTYSTQFIAPSHSLLVFDGIKMCAKILVNGHDRTEQRALEFFQENSGYLLQLAETTSSELTVRENLVYAAMLRIPHMTLAEVLVRVDQVLLSLGMLEMAERAETFVLLLNSAPEKQGP